MSVSRRVILSVSCLMLLAIGALGYQLWILYGMQQINTELSNINFQAASQLLKLQRDSYDVERMTQRYVAVSDEKLKESVYEGLVNRIGLVNTDFDMLRSVLEDQETPREIEEMLAFWNEYLREIERTRQSAGAGAKGEFPPDLDLAIASVTNVQDIADAAYDIETERVRAQVRRSSQAGSRAETFSLIAGSAFLVLAAMSTYFILRTINIPLKHLTRGTRSVSQGNFSHRLPVKGPLEFAELASDFNAMSARLEVLDEMKRDFVSHVSHELKAPLASIHQTLHVALEEVPGPLNEKQKNLLKLSRQSAERLSAMVANLLDVSRLEAGTMEYEMAPQDLVRLARSVVEEFALSAQQSGVSLSVVAESGRVPVVCDRDRLIQVVGNLIDNALKFSPAGSTIEVNVSGIGPERNGLARLSVADEGPGVADQYKRDIFEKFHQVKGGSKRVGQGVGLGLAICKTIVEAHQGRIWVEDNPGGGSVFSVELPAAMALETVQCS